MEANRFSNKKIPTKYIKGKDFEIEYEFLATQDSETRLLQAYELVFSEVEKMLVEQKDEYKTDSLLC